MAIEIHFAPTLTGETAERFVYEAEHRPVTMGQLSREEEEMIDRAEAKARAFKEKYYQEHGVRL